MSIQAQTGANSGAQVLNVGAQRETTVGAQTGANIGVELGTYIDRVEKAGCISNDT